jgi:chorismate mutase/prephenate dehydratase
MRLRDLRDKIDDIDARIVRLLAERLRTAEDIGKEKRKNGRSIEDKAREEEVLNKVKAVALSEGVNQENITGIYRQIINTSRGTQGAEVAFQGEAGAYSEEAAISFFGPAVVTSPCETLDDVFKDVQEGNLPYGIVPVENSQEGSISRSYDLLLDSDVTVCGETLLRVSHCLIANKGAGLDSIKKIYSHPQALAQCQGFLRRLGCELIPTYDTAGSVKMIKEKSILDGAAVASARSAQIYGMKIIAREIEDNPRNTTRFFIISKQDAAPTGNDKTSIVFLLRHRPGTLHDSLKVFADRNINLTKIESRPTRQKPWEYNFYLDFEGHRQDKIVLEALEELERTCLFLKVLGSYPKAKMR